MGHRIDQKITIISTENKSYSGPPLLLSQNKSLSAHKTAENSHYLKITLNKCSSCMLMDCVFVDAFLIPVAK